MSSSEVLKHERKVLDEVLKAYGDWSSKLIIGGGYAPIIYRLYFSPETSPVPIMTMDLDTLVRTESDRTEDEERPTLYQLLTSHGFKWNPKNLSNTPPESYKKEIDGQEAEVEFITHKQPRNRDASEIKVSGVVAQALSYLEMSFERPLNFKSTAVFMD